MLEHYDKRQGKTGQTGLGNVKQSNKKMEFSTFRTFGFWQEIPGLRSIWVK